MPLLPLSLRLLLLELVSILAVIGIFAQHSFHLCPPLPHTTLAFYFYLSSTMNFSSLLLVVGLRLLAIRLLAASTLPRRLLVRRGQAGPRLTLPRS